MKHWKKLKERLIEKSTVDEYSEKGIFKEIKSEYILYRFNLLPFENSQDWPSIEIPHESKALTAEEIKETLEKEIDNTGNVRIWPSEEFLSVWCLLKGKEFWSNKSVIELGAGKSGLAGLIVSHFTNVLITDGNQECVDSLHKLN